MTEYTEKVIQRAKEIAAHEWSRGVKAVHVHKMNSMWYEPEPDVAKDQSVTDIEYNDGSVRRNGVEILRAQFSGKALIREWETSNEL
jgi:2-polyprenyl-3-methyl-5-hydroxy-6-metoxy-1,4-benzoquinol methylase